MGSIIIIIIAALSLFVVYNLFNSQSEIGKNCVSDKNKCYKNRASDRNKTYKNRVSDRNKTYKNRASDNKYNEKFHTLYYTTNNYNDDIEQSSFFHNDVDNSGNFEDNYQDDFYDEEYYEYMDAEYENYERED